LDARNNNKLKAYEKIPCKYCKEYKTYEGHDGCLGELIGISNACCGHGGGNEAYVQFYDGTVVSGGDATIIQAILKKHSPGGSDKERLLFLKNSVKFQSEMWDIKV